MASQIKTLQRGTITLASVTSNTATVTSVDVTKASLRYFGTSNAVSFSDGCRIALTNATIITATRGAADNTTVVSFELTEYF